MRISDDAGPGMNRNRWFLLSRLILILSGFAVAYWISSNRGRSKKPDASTLDGGASAAVACAELSCIRYEHNGAVAEVVTWHNESALTIFIDNRVFFRKAYLTDSGHIGFNIMDAAWSPQGTYFAFKLSSAGGHMPYRTPVMILDCTAGAPVLIDAESIIKKIPEISNIAVSHYEKPYIKWLSGSELQVNVMSHDNEADAGQYIINLETLSARQLIEIIN
ncbi:MAG: hypothetical protein PF495_00090 [Spirochaetales bacterium]|jgi:hypothetical protein|nr:hypothetical protein [Spirochaetales bacterium]